MIGTAEMSEQETAANYMGAIAHILTGSPDRQEEFRDKVDLILSGSPPDAIQLLQFTEQVRRTARPYLWVHCDPSSPNVPQIGLVAWGGNQACVFEMCMLWMPKSSGRARLVPDSFTMGSFRFDDDMRLRRSPRAPVADFEAAKDGITRAYERLAAIQVEQIERGVAFDLPELAKAA